MTRINGGWLTMPGAMQWSPMRCTITLRSTAILAVTTRTSLVIFGWKNIMMYTILSTCTACTLQNALMALAHIGPRLMVSSLSSSPNMWASYLAHACFILSLVFFFLPLSFWLIDIEFVLLFFRRTGIRCLQAMIPAFRITVRRTSTAQMFRRPFMPMWQGWTTTGLIAGIITTNKRGKFATYLTWILYPSTGSNLQVSVCNGSDVLTNWTDSPATMLPTIRKLIDGGLRVWVYRWDFMKLVSTKSLKHL